MMATGRRDDGYDLAEQTVRTHDCPDCPRNVLVNRWNRELQHYEAACPNCGRTDGFRRRKSLTAVWRENPDSVPIEVANKMADKHRDEIEAVAEGLPPELAEAVRERYFGPQPKKEN